MVSNDQIRFFMHFLPLLAIVFVIALCSFMVRRRDVFCCGVIGAILVSLIPSPRVYDDYSSVEGAVMGMFAHDFSHSLSYGVCGAIIGVFALGFWHCSFQFVHYVFRPLW